MKLINYISVIAVMLISMQVIGQSKKAKKAFKTYETNRANYLKTVTNPKAIAKATRGSYGVYSNYERKYNAKNNLCSEDAYKTPKKVAILSYYIEDSDYKTYTTGLIKYYEVFTKSTEEKVNAIAQIIYNQSINNLKEEYAKLGMELQTPDEYLTTPELKNAYYNYKLPNLESRLSKFDLSGSGAAVPDAYRLFAYNSVVGAQGKHFYKEKMDFFSALGFDAMVVIAIKLTAANNGFNGIQSSFIFKNPGWDKSGKEGMIVGYAPFNQGFMTTTFDPMLNGIFIKEKEDTIDKKGKPDFKLVNTEVDSNIANIVVYNAVELAKKSIAEIEKASKKKKKKK